MGTYYAKIMDITHCVNKHQPRENISNAEKRTLKHFQAKDFCFLLSDKGTKFCVVENLKYNNQAAFQHLSDTFVYKLLT